MITQTIKYKTIEYSYKNGIGKGQDVVRDLLVVTKDEYEVFTSKSKSYTTERELMKGDKVYFMSNVLFPKKKFKESFPENKIVHDIDKADVIIIDKMSLDEFLKRKIQFGNYRIDPTSNVYTIDYSNLGHILSQPYYEKEVERTVEIDKILDKRLIDITDINLSSDNVITEESYKSIGQMLGASDPEIIQMGMNILTGYDYDKCKSHIRLLIALYWENWIRSPKRKTNIELKTILRKIQVDFRNITELKHSPSFWFTLILDSPNDVIVIAAFNDWIRTHIKTDKQLILKEC